MDKKTEIYYYDLDLRKIKTARFREAVAYNKCAFEGWSSTRLEALQCAKVLAAQRIKPIQDGIVALEAELEAEHSATYEESQ